MSTTNVYGWSFSGGAYALPMDITDTRFVLYTGGNQTIPFSWNGSTLTARKLYGSSYTLNNPTPYSTISFSFTQQYVGYAIAYNSNSDPAIFSYNFSSTSTAPTGVQIVDLATCVPPVAGLGYTWNDDVIVSQDDQTFATAVSTTTGQASSGAVYVVVWNRTNGCRVWNTSTGAVTGAWGTTGIMPIADKFTIHAAAMGQGGTWLLLTAGTCLNNGCAASPTWKNYFWNIQTLTETALTTATGDACGHFALGYSSAINQCFYGSGYNSTQWYQRPMVAPNTSPPTGVINSGSPAGSTSLDQHASWATDNSSDTGPFCTSTDTGAFAVSYPYDNEINCVAMNGTGTVWRFAHTYATHQSASFEAEIALGGVSADGKWFLWTSDWDGMLGNTSGTSNSCTLGTNCRNDVFIVALTQSKVTEAPAAPTGLSANVAY